MKILHITASYKPAYVYGGPIYSVAALCEALLKSKEQRTKNQEVENRKFNGESQKLKIESEKLNEKRGEGFYKDDLDINVYTTLANGKKELPYPSGELKIIEGVPVTYFKRWTKDHSHFSPSLLWYLWKNVKQFDVVHVHAWWNLISMGAVVVCLLKGVKPIISPRGMLGDYTFSKGKTLFHEWIGKYLLRKCNFHATTLMEAEEIIFRLGKAEIVDLMEDEGPKTEDRGRKTIQPIVYVIHNIVNLPKIMPEKIRTFDGTLKLIFLSRIHLKKGIELLLDALSEVKFPFLLNIVGEGEVDYVESLKLKVESLNLSSKTNWMGAVYGDEKYKLLSNHDILVLPSFNENFANIVMESVATGTPVLVSNKVGLNHWVLQNELGYVCNLDVDSVSIQLKKHIELLKIKPDYKVNKITSLAIQEKYLEMYERIS